ncbi:hypothetical protein NADFUDRAFT_66723 [Nadsonia fulvescens var. elongata DSM 6958]|uniref:M-phase phosphoprotein 6 n=1 Tax=Nadsonia fulvescens var. elongata DSM 6958 TaxID=857566 RepID=A0A1E3PGW7_9ASCO|nr:hypothetical protein NADFUDRAFT_66723 [Nadsonia fulvescens var. elongata DSM 6958]
MAPPTKPKGLSSAVMNMKFMRTAENKAKNHEEELERKQVDDASRWAWGQPSDTTKKIKSQPKLAQVGYTDIQNIVSSKKSEFSHTNSYEESVVAPPGRRSYGGFNKKFTPTGEANDEEKLTTVNPDDEDEMDIKQKDKLLVKTAIHHGSISGGGSNAANSAKKRVNGQNELKSNKKRKGW